MSKNRPFTTLEPKKIKADYPKTYKSITEWLKKCATEGNIITEEMVQAFIYGNPRFLYDYFDDNGQTLQPDLVKYNDRKEAEEALFEEAFKEQEGKL